MDNAPSILRTTRSASSNDPMDDIQESSVVSSIRIDAMRSTSHFVIRLTDQNMFPMPLSRKTPPTPSPGTPVIIQRSHPRRFRLPLDPMPRDLGTGGVNHD